MIMIARGREVERFEEENLTLTQHEMGGTPYSREEAEILAYTVCNTAAVLSEDAEELLRYILQDAEWRDGWSEKQVSALHELQKAIGVSAT